MGTVKLPEGPRCGPARDALDWRPPPDAASGPGGLAAYCSFCKFCSCSFFCKLFLFSMVGFSVFWRVRRRCKELFVVAYEVYRR